MEDELIPRAKAARILGVTPQTVSNYVRRGWFTSVTRKGGSRSHFYVFRNEVTARQGLIRKVADAETRLEETLKEVSRNQFRADALLKKSVAAVLGASRSEALLRRLLGLIGTLLDKTSRTAPAFTETDREILVRLLSTADLKKVCEEEGLTDEGVMRRVRTAVSKLARARNACETADALRERVDALEKENAGLCIALAKAGEKAAGEAAITDEAFHEVRRKLMTDIADVGLSLRAFNCCRARGVNTVGDLVQYSRPEVRAFRNLGEKSLCEIDELLRGLGLTYGMDATGYGVKVSRRRA